MRDDYEKFTALGATIAVVVHDSPEAVAAYWKKENLPYLGLPDPDGKLGKLYGQEWKLFRLGRMPAQYVISADGAVVFRHHSESMSDIPENARILKVLEGLR